MHRTPCLSAFLAALLFACVASVGYAGDPFPRRVCGVSAKLDARGVPVECLGRFTQAARETMQRLERLCADTPSTAQLVRSGKWKRVVMIAATGPHPQASAALMDTGSLVLEYYDGNFAGDDELRAVLEGREPIQPND